MANFGKKHVGIDADIYKHTSSTRTGLTKPAHITGAGYRSSPGGRRIELWKQVLCTRPPRLAAELQ